MDTINTRIATLINESGKTKSHYAIRLHVTPQFVSSLCNGKKTPSDRTIGDICRLFGVREEWLRNGDEPMYSEPEPDPLDQLLKDRGIAPDELPAIKSLVMAFLELEKPARNAVIQFVQSFTEKLNVHTKTSIKLPQEMSDTELHAELDRQLAEQKKRAENPLAYGHGKSDTAAG